MKILFIVDYYFPAIGGAEILYQHLAEGLVKRGHEVVVLTQLSNNALPEERVNGVQVCRVKTWHRALFPYQAYSAARELYKWADIVQTATYSGAVLAQRAKGNSGKKVLLIVHEYLGLKWLRFGLRGILAFVYECYVFRKHFDGYISVSQCTADKLVKLRTDAPLEVIPNGVDNSLFVAKKSNETLRESLGIGSKQFLFLFAGRPGISKGIFQLLGAIRLMNNQPQAVFVMLVASEPRAMRQKVINYISRHKLQNVRLLHSVDRAVLPQYIASANAVIIPSLSEGFGFFAAEVSQMHVPLIVSAVDALPEVAGGEVIFLQQVTSHSVYQACLAAMNNRFEHVEHKRFDWSKTVLGYEQFYKHYTK